MFDFTGLFSRHDDANETNIAAPEQARPVDYLVFKDGTPFTYLNATPALAERTIRGFALATPDCQYTFERC